MYLLDNRSVFEDPDHYFEERRTDTPSELVQKAFFDAHWLSCTNSCPTEYGVYPNITKDTNSPVIYLRNKDGIHLAYFIPQNKTIYFPQIPITNNTQIHKKALEPLIQVIKKVQDKGYITNLQIKE